MKVQLRDIEIVQTIAAFGAIHSAASELGLSQPALTKRLKSIEDRLQLVMFHRLPRGVRLTSAGKIFLDGGAELPVHAADFQEEIFLHRAGHKENLRVGIKPGLNDIFVRRSMTSFAKSYPKVKLKIQLSSSPTLCQAVRSGELDFALVGLGYEDDLGEDPALHESLSFEPMFLMPLEAIVRKSHPILSNLGNPSDILNFPLASPPPPPSY